MTDQDKTGSDEPEATELEEQDLDKAVGGAKPRGGGGRGRTSCPCDGGE